MNNQDRRAVAEALQLASSARAQIEGLLAASGAAMPQAVRKRLSRTVDSHLCDAVLDLSAALEHGR